MSIDNWPLVPPSTSAVGAIAEGIRLLHRHKPEQACDALIRALNYTGTDDGKADIRVHWWLYSAFSFSGHLGMGWRSLNRVLDASRPRSEKRWSGEPLDGKTLLIWQDLKLGDTVQLIRYAPILAARGARVLVLCDPRLVSFVRRIEGVTAAVPFGGKLPQSDFEFPLGALPCACGLVTESDVPWKGTYPALDDSAVDGWRLRLRDTPGLKVGLCWAAGEPDLENLRWHRGTPGLEGESIYPERSMPARLLVEACSMPGVTLYTLQRGQGEAEAEEARAAGFTIHELEGREGDVLDAASAIAALDLVITVDTMVAHLAGAIGKPAWMLLSHTPECRWMLGRRDTPWYPTMRLFRQEAKRDWSGALRLLRADLEMRANANSEGHEGPRLSCDGSVV